MCAHIKNALRRLRRDEQGQSLIIVAIAMVVVIGVSAFAIDVASWYTKHHQTQVVADAAALAAANCLAHPNAPSGLGPTCTSTSDTSDATTVAQDYAAANGIPNLPASDVQINTTNDTVQVTPSANAPAFFAKLFGIHSEEVSSSSTASWKSGPTPCSKATSTTDCAAIYAGNETCTSGDGVVSGSSYDGATLDVAGNIHSEGLLTFANNGALAGIGSVPPSLSVAGSCYTSTDLPEKDSYTASQVASEPWPIDYSAAPYFTACTTNCVSVNGSPPVPPYCTQVSTNTSTWVFNDINGVNDLPISGNVYCAVGSGTPSNPATWNETIALESQDCSSPWASVTFIGGSVTFSNGTNGGATICLQPELYNCLVYTTGSFDMTNSTFDWTGDIFAPNGTITLGTASSPGVSASGITATSTSGMLEGQNVDMQNLTLTLTGDGTVASGSGGNTGGSDSLVQ